MLGETSSFANARFPGQVDSGAAAAEQAPGLILPEAAPCSLAQAGALLVRR